MRLWPDLSLNRIDRLPSEGLKSLPDRLWPFLWFFLRQLKWPFLMTACLFALGNIAFTLEPVFIGRVIGAISDAAKAGTPPDIAMQSIMPIVITYLVWVQIGGRLCWQTGHGIEIKLFPVFVMLIRRQLAIYLHGHSYRYFQDDFAGRLSGKVVEMPQSIHLVVKMMLNQLLFTIVNLSFATALLIGVDWRFGVCALLYVACYVCFLVFFAPRVQKRAQTAADQRHHMRGQFVDTVSNVLLVKLFSHRRYEDQRFLNAVKNAGDAEVAENAKMYILFRCQHILNAFYQAAIILIAVYAWRAGLIGVKGAATALPLSLQMVGNCWWLMENYAEFTSRLGEIKSGIASVVVTQDVTDKPDAPPLKIKDGALDFENVRFSYPSRPVFENFTLHIPARQRVGFVGPSGAGKSSLMQILLRLHDVQDGRILIDGQNIADIAQDSVRDAIAFIPQSADLLHRTIRENIAYGDLNADEAAIIRAAKVAQAHDFIVGLSDSHGGRGYDATVGERGVKLSGGQRQRVAIARAILKDAPIVVLDEATSSLDSESERLIQDSLKSLMQGRTVLAIAHRLSTIAHLDRLIVMEEGRIAEDGTHADLLAKGGLYARLWNLQSGGFLGDAAH